MISRKERLAEFFRRMMLAEPQDEFETAYRLLCDTLTEVEEEHSGVPNHPEDWRTDGRMYPPQEDSFQDVEHFPDVVGMGTRGHTVYIGPNGSIEIRVRGAEVVLEKPGADGKGVWE